MDAAGVCGEEFSIFEDPEVWCSFVDVLKAAHDGGWINNDVKARHLLRCDGARLIIDWGGATANGAKAVTYTPGYASTAVLECVCAGRVIWAEPTHDLEALVWSIFALVYPHYRKAVRGLNEAEVLTARQTTYRRFAERWSFAPAFTAARGGDYEGLREALAGLLPIALPEAGSDAAAASAEPYAGSDDAAAS